MFRNIVYSLIAGITAPIGGGLIAGYLYASRENDFARMQGLSDPKIPVLSALIGGITGLFVVGGLYYGYKLGDVENRIDQLRVRENQSTTPSYAARDIVSSQERTPDISRIRTDWRDRVEQEISDTQSRQR